MHEWNDFFVATAGAAAALTGLIFVGISVNLSRILSYQTLPVRASLSLILLVSILLFSLLLLIPKESTTTIGYFVTLLGLIVWIVISRSDIKVYRQTDIKYKRLFLFNLLLDQLAILPYIVGGLSFLFVGEVGFCWISVAFLISFIKAVSDAWVLLIEILR